MLNMIMIAAYAMAADQATAPQQTFIQEVDAHRLNLCSDDLFAFRNVPMRCTVGENGNLGQCEILTDHRLVHRHSRKFHCMAEQIRISRTDGVPATGTIVHLKFDAGSLFTESFVSASGHVE